MYAIDGDRIRLRPLRDADYPVFFAYRSDPAVCRYQGFDVFDEEMAREFLQEQGQLPFGVDGAWVNVGIEDKTTGTLLGDVAIHILERNPKLVELGYTLHPDNQGKGYATEAIKVALRVLFGSRHIHKAIAEVDTRNPASYLLLERLGFRREAHLRQSFYDLADQAWFDEYWYGLLATDFKY